jgi:glycine/D-amino acid oxidase-like deaminating enzyme
MQPQDATEDIVIAGAGLAGLGVALGLHRYAWNQLNPSVCSVFQRPV